MEKNNVKPLAWFFGGVAVGAVALYYLDPNQGRRRRALFRDQIVARNHDLQIWSNRFSKDIYNRAWGLYREWALPPSKDVDDQTLASRIRSHLGRDVRHPKSIHTDVRDGIVTLSGPILIDEVKKLIAKVKKVPGVKDVINHLDVRESSQGEPGLQGRGPKYLQ